MTTIIYNKPIFSYDDFYILPHQTTSLNEYNEIDIYDETGKLPIFTAPIDSIIDEQNFELFSRTRLHIIVPDYLDIKFRIEKLKEGHWVSMTMQEFNKYILVEDIIGQDHDIPSYKILINSYVGNSSDLIDIIKRAKEKYKDNLTLMAGKVANPSTYNVLANIGVEYVRCSIGCENLCGEDNPVINYPIGTLLEDIKELKDELIRQGKFAPKIVINGCIKYPKDIVKALALGADYVMCGKLFSASIESAAHIVDGVDYIDRTLEENTPIITEIIEYNPDIVIQHKIILFGNYGKINICNLKNEKLQGEHGVEIININKNKYDNTQYYYIIDTNNIEMSEAFKKKIIRKHKFQKVYHCVQPCNIRNLLDNCTVHKRNVLIQVEYTINEVVNEIENILKYCMLRCDAKHLKAFIGNQTLILNK